MHITRRTGTIAFFITLGACLVLLALMLNVGWIILYWRKIVPLILGIVFFGVLIAGLVLNTIFLVREVKRNERQDSFLNAVTHELKTPIASIRLYLETLQRRELNETQRQEFYRIMLSDSDRLLSTVEQVLKAGELGQRQSDLMRIPIEMASLMRECVEIARTRHHLPDAAITLELENGEAATVVLGNLADLRSALLNVLDNAIKYSKGTPQIAVRICLEHDAWVVVRVRDAGIGISPVHSSASSADFIARHVWPYCAPKAPGSASSWFVLSRASMVATPRRKARAKVTEPRSRCNCLDSSTCTRWSYNHGNTTHLPARQYIDH